MATCRCTQYTTNPTGNLPELPAIKSEDISYTTTGSTAAPIDALTGAVRLRPESDVYVTLHESDDATSVGDVAYANQNYEFHVPPEHRGVSYVRILAV